MIRIFFHFFFIYPFTFSAFILLLSFFSFLINVFPYFSSFLIFWFLRYIPICSSLPISYRNLSLFFIDAWISPLIFHFLFTQWLIISSSMENWRNSLIHIKDLEESLNHLKNSSSGVQQETLCNFKIWTIRSTVRDARWNRLPVEAKFRTELDCLGCENSEQEEKLPNWNHFRIKRFENILKIRNLWNIAKLQLVSEFTIFSQWIYEFTIFICLLQYIQKSFWYYCL